MDVTLDFIDKVDSAIKQLNSEEDKADLLSHIHYNLGGLLACVEDSLGHGFSRKHIVLPKDLLSVLQKYQLVIFDHLDRINIDGNTIYVTNPYYAVSSDVLERLMADLKEIGYTFSVSAESNYFPARTLRFEFMKWKT